MDAMKRSSHCSLSQSRRRYSERSRLPAAPPHFPQPTWRRLTYLLPGEESKAAESFTPRLLLETCLCASVSNAITACRKADGV